MNIHSFIRSFSHIVPVVTAEAHCDAPCGVYDPTAAKLAAKTVVRMVMQIEELKAPDMGDAKAVAAYMNSISRRIAVKEEHAERCKRELLVLWGDFFKPEHLTDYPDLHDMFWKTVKLAGKNKHEVSVDCAQELCASVDAIAKIFYDAKKAPEKFGAYTTVTEKLW